MEFDYILSDDEFEALLICDDNLGLSQLLEGLLNKSEDDIISITNSLLSKNLIRKEKSDIARVNQNNVHDQYWHFTTILGRNYLKKMGHHHISAP